MKKYPTSKSPAVPLAFIKKSRIRLCLQQPLGQKTNDVRLAYQNRERKGGLL